MARYARIDSGDVVEIASIPPDIALEDAFTSDIVASMVAVESDDVTPGWTFDGAAFAPPAGPPLSDLKDRATRAIAAACDAAALPYTAEYSAAERDTWRKQETEARAVLDGSLAASDASFLMLLTGGVYQGVHPLAEKIVAKEDLFEQAVAAIISVRRTAADDVASASSPDAVDEALATMKAALATVAA